MPTVDRSSKRGNVSMCSSLLLVMSLLGNANAITNSFVQENTGPSTIQSKNTSVAVAYPDVQTAGNLNIVAVGWGDNVSAISSVTDARGNTYSLAVGPTSNTGLQQAIYYAKNIASGSNTVTVKFNQAAVYPDVRILEYSGLNSTSPLDVTAAATGSGTTASSSSATTTSANELIFDAGTTTGITFTASGSGFTTRLVDIYGNMAEDKTVSSTGSYAATATITGAYNSSYWIMQMVAFKLAAHSVAVSWKASASKNITGYNVYRSTIPGGYYGLVGSTASLAYTDSTVVSGTTYYYVTTAVDSQGQQSGYSNQVIATVSSP